MRNKKNPPHLNLSVDAGVGLSRSVASSLGINTSQKGGNRNAATLLDNTPLPLWRSRLILFVLFCLFVSLLGRAVWISILDNQFYSIQGKKRSERTFVLHATRGKIFDRDHNLLATSLQASSLWVEPEEVNLNDKKWQKAAQWLQMPASDIEQKIQKSKKNFLYIKRKIPPEFAKEILSLKIKGLHSVAEPKRYYTQGEGLAQLIGITNIDHQGQEGLELSLNDRLKGTAGEKKIVRDRLGNTVDESSERDLGVIAWPMDGENIHLSIDAHLQNEVFKTLKAGVLEHKAKFASAVVLGAKTGEILAIANWPSFNPNDASQIAHRQNMRNYAFTDVFEVGSTIKPINIGIALDQGKVSANSVIDTRPFKIQDHVVTDSHPHARMNVLEIIQKSSNIGTVKIANTITAESMWQTYQKLGLGQAPSINFPSIATGRLRNWKTWRPIEKATMSYGYGLSASILQLAQAYTPFANDGLFLPLSLEKISNPRENPQHTRVFSSNTTQSILQGLAMVTQKGGTATKAQVTGYSVGGKTGTVHKQVQGQYSSHQYRSFFVGLAPLDKPAVIIAVMFDEPSNGKYYGGDVAAPAFARIADISLKHLQIPANINMQKPSKTSQQP